MKKNKELEIVKQLTNVIEGDNIVLNEAGSTSRVYIVNNGKTVFKFLKNKQYREVFDHEINILNLINEHKFNLNIPSISCFGENNSYIVLNGVKGKSIKTELIEKLTEQQKRK